MAVRDENKLHDLRRVAATVRRITVFPVKSLEGQEVEAAAVLNGGGLEHDRRYAFFSREGGGWIRAKDFPQLITVRAKFDFGRGLIQVQAPAGAAGSTSAAAAEFQLDLERPALEEWMSRFLGHAVVLKESPTLGFFDDSKRGRHGVSLISTATLQALCDWFPHCDLQEMRRRLRTNIEVDGVEAFWEEAQIAREGEAAQLRIGAAVFAAAASCPRCSVPERNSHTAAVDSRVKENFGRLRTEGLPEFVDPALFKLPNSVAIRVNGLPQTARCVVAPGDRVEFVATETQSV